jgi:hypothetical protein
MLSGAVHRVRSSRWLDDIALRPQKCPEVLEINIATCRPIPIR